MSGLEIPEDLDLTQLNDKQKINLLDKLFFKILASETDLDFQENLHIYLPKLIEKLSTNEEIVRKKVMEILVHVNKRVKSRPNVQLPIYDLIRQFNHSTANNQSFVSNFSLIYLKMSFPRLEPKQKANLVIDLLNCLEGKSNSQQDTLLSFIVDALKYLELTINDSSNVDKYGLLHMAKIRKYFLDYLFNFLLLPYETPTSKPVVVATTSQPTETQNTSTLTTTSEIPACLSERLYKQFKSDVNLENAEELEELKCAILKFLSLNIYPNEDVVFHYIIATSDTRYNVVRVAELNIKRITSVNWNDQTIVNRIFQLFLGDKLQKKTTQRADLIIEPANTRIRLKLFPYILRSRTAANTIPQCIQIVFDCLFGATNTNKKLKHYSVQFVHEIAMNCEFEKLNKVGAVLVQGVNKLINETKDDNKLRGLAYVAVGKFARRIPNVFSSDTNIVRNFFNALAMEDSDTKLNIQEALVLMIEAFRNCSEGERKILLKMLFQYIENDVSQCRSMAIKYTFEIFANDDLESRYLLILAASDNKEDIRQEAIKCLRRTHDYDNNELKIADFLQLVNFISEKAQERRTNNIVHTIGTRTLPFDVNSYFEALVLIRLSLSKSAELKPQIIDLKSIDLIKDEAPLLVKYLENLAINNINALSKYVRLVKDYAITIGNALGVYLLLEICATSPFSVTKVLIEDLEWIKNQSFSVKEDVRFYAAELWSLVLTNNIINDAKDSGTFNFDRLFKHLIKLKTSNIDNDNKSFEQRFGSILCIGFGIGKFYNACRNFNLKNNFENELKPLIESVVSLLDDHYLSYAAIISFGEIARNGDLLLEKEKMSKIIDLLQHKIQTSAETNKVKERAVLTLSYICVGDDKFEYNEDIMQRLLNSAQIKQIELHMAIGESLINCALGVKSPAARNNWTCLESDWKPRDASLKDRLEWLLDEILEKYIESSNPHIRQAATFWLLILLKKFSNISDCVLKKIVKIQDAFINRLGENDDLTQEVASKAIGLIYTLTDAEQKKDLVSKLVDTLSGNNTKKKAVLKIQNENEEVFKDDQLGKTPDGASINTYKELCSLASDLNKPDLIYRFMNIAHHNSIWNTRRGAAFGFSTIAQLASDELQQYLPNLVPKLFRYQFDPNQKIQTTMQSIWSYIVTADNKKILDKYLDLILVDIEQNMLSSLWRVRESCCLALCDLLKGGRNLESISNKFGVFWSLLFKLIDDIKESVRNAAELAIKSLNRVTISYSTAVSNSQICQQTINGVLPILIKDGINSKLSEVREISVKTILELAKQSTPTFLKPYIVELIPNLLETLSGYESSELNYLSLKLNSQDLQEKLDLARISTSKSTPMIEIINLTLDLVDADILDQLIPKLIEILRRGLGVSTKAGVCHIIVTLINSNPTLIAPYAGKLMAALVNSISNEPNKTVRKSYCNTLGSIVKIAKESSIENLLNKLKEWYFEKDDDGIKLSCGLTLLAIVQNNNDILIKYSKMCAPFVFFALHQQNESQNRVNQNMESGEPAQNVWTDVWEDITSGTEYAIKTHMAEILDLIKIGIDHQSWKMRIQASLALSTIFNKLQSKIEPVFIDEILNVLIHALSTRTWTGKEKVLIVVSNLFNNCKLVLKNDNELVMTITRNIFKEASKQSSNIDNNYKLCALRSLADILEYSSANFADKDFEMYWSEFIEKYFEKDFENLEKIELEKQLKKEQAEQMDTTNEASNVATQQNEPEENIKKLKLDDVNDVKSSVVKKGDDEEEEGNTELFGNLRLICLETFGKCWPHNHDMQEKYLKKTVYLLAENINKVTWTHQMSIIKSMSQIIEKWSIEFNDSVVELCLNAINMCIVSTVTCIAKTKYSNLKRDGLNFIEKILNFIKKEKLNESVNSIPCLKVIYDNIIESIRVLLDEYTTDSTIDIKEKSKTMIKNLNSNY